MICSLILIILGIYYVFILFLINIWENFLIFWFSVFILVIFLILLFINIVENFIIKNSFK